MGGVAPPALQPPASILATLAVKAMLATWTLTPVVVVGRKVLRYFWKTCAALAASEPSTTKGPPRYLTVWLEVLGATLGGAPLQSYLSTGKPALNCSVRSGVVSACFPGSMIQ